MQGLGNKIVRNETVEWIHQDGHTIIAIEMALDIRDLSQAEPFVAEVAEAFFRQRMVSPPETRGLLITIVGKMQPDEFALLWSWATAENEPLKVFMSKMEVADVVGSMRDRDPDKAFGVSLLPKP